MNALLSIKPRYAEAILSGTKKWEFRRRGFREPPDKIYIYCTNPVRKVVGSFEVSEIISGSPEEIWRRCGKEGAILRGEFLRYSFSSGVVYAIEISCVKKFKVPIELNSLGKNRPPQSFYYIDDVHSFYFKRRKFSHFGVIKKLISKLDAFRRRRLWS